MHVSVRLAVGSAAGLTFCSVDVVSSIGWGGAVSCAVAVAVHLTLLPALLVVSGRCCGDAGRALRWRRCCSCRCPGRCCGRAATRELASLSEQLAVDGLPSEASKADGNEALWIRLGEFDRCAQRCVFLSAKSLLFGSGPETIRGSGQQPGVAAGISGARSWR